MQFVKASTLYRDYVPASRLQRSRLDRIREEMCIPWKELNKLAKNVVGREFGDVSRLSASENRKVIQYLERNRLELMNRYRKVVWNL